MKKRVIWIIGLIILAGIAAIFISKSGNQAVAVEISKVYKGNIAEYVEEKGTVKLEEETSVYSSENGKILEILVETGEEVKAGDILARMDDKDLQLQIKALEAQKQAASARYDEAKSPASEENIRKLNSQLQSVTVAYENAKRSVESSKALLDSGAVSLDEYQKTLASFTAAEAAFEAARSSLASAQRELSDNVKRQYEAQIAEIKARIEQIEKKRSNMVIHAAISGTVLHIDAKEGSIAQPGTRLFEIGNKNAIYLESNILVEDIGKVRDGASVLIDNEDLGIKDVEGTVRKIYPKAFSKMSDLGIEQKRVTVEISLSNDITAVLKPGYDVDIRVIANRIDNALLINEKALFDYQGKSYVFVNDNDIAKLRQVEKGIESDGQVEVLKGLEENETVILSPDEKIEEGTKIKYQEAL